LAASGSLSAAALAPLVDMLTILLVALLRSWSTEAPANFAEEGFALPLSRQEAPVDRGVTIDVGTSGLYVEGWRAGSATYWTDSDDVLVTEVYEALQSRGGTRAVIRAHKDAPWSLVGKVLFTAQQAGYGDVELVAVASTSL